MAVNFRGGKTSPIANRGTPEEIKENILRRMSGGKIGATDLIPLSAIENKIAEIVAADADDKASGADLELEWHLLEVKRWWQRDRSKDKKEV